MWVSKYSIKHLERSTHKNFAVWQIYMWQLQMMHSCGNTFERSKYKSHPCWQNIDIYGIPNVISRDYIEACRNSKPVLIAISAKVCHIYLLYTRLTGQHAPYDRPITKEWHHQEWKKITSHRSCWIASDISQERRPAKEIKHNMYTQHCVWTRSDFFTIKFNILNTSWAWFCNFNVRKVYPENCIHLQLETLAKLMF